MLFLGAERAPWRGFGGVALEVEVEDEGEASLAARRFPNDGPQAFHEPRIMGRGPRRRKDIWRKPKKLKEVGKAHSNRNAEQQNELPPRPSCRFHGGEVSRIISQVDHCFDSRKRTRLYS